jgi:hypothetical protein
MLPHRASRFLGLDRNPLQRRVDRVEAWLTVLLTATFVFVGPFVAWRAGDTAYREALHMARISQRDHVRADAVLEEDAVLTYSGSDISPVVQRPVRARWQGPDGSSHRGTIVPARPGPAGTVLPVWTDATGSLTMPPRTVVSMRLEGVRTGLVVLLILGGALAATRMLVRCAANRRRLAWWQGEWMLIEPRWTNRR